MKVKNNICTAIWTFYEKKVNNVPHKKLTEELIEILDKIRSHSRKNSTKFHQMNPHTRYIYQFVHKKKLNMIARFPTVKVEPIDTNAEI